MLRVRTRFAPSPTGSVHIGSIQKIVYSYACAKKYGGDYLLRIEDTDQTRFVEGAEAEIYQLHDELGIKIDESPRNPNPKYGNYRQTERKHIYKEYAEKLVDMGHAYYAFETPEELAEMRNIAQSNKQQFKYKSEYRDMDTAAARKLALEKPYVIRIKLPKNKIISWNDLIMGDISVNTDSLDDYVLFKSDGLPTYHLAVVIDDHLMEISHVFRGVEWLPTAPIHVLLYELFGWEQPLWAHIPNLLDPKGGKLSKRSGSVAAMEFFKEGYLPEAVMNYMMLQSWNPKTNQEIFSLIEFIDAFDIAKFNKSNPVFDRQKLLWFNEQHLRSLSEAELGSRLLAWLKKFHADQEDFTAISKLDKKVLEQIIFLEKERSSTYLDLANKLLIFTSRPQHYEFDNKFLKKMETEIVIEVIKQYKGFLTNSDDEYSHESWEQFIRDLADDLALPAGAAFMSIRIALTGIAATPPLFEVGKVFGIEEQLVRLQQAIEFLQA